MKVFVGFGYNDRDKWVPDLVFTIIRAFGDDVMTGEDLQGDQITDAVRQKIKQSTAFIGFATRRDKIGDSKWTTHRWVTDEMAWEEPRMRSASGRTKDMTWTSSISRSCDCFGQGRLQE